MSDFTKGPWIADHSSWHTIDIRGPEGDYIADVMTYVCGESDDSDQDWDQINMQKANAALIASAPCLLAALLAITNSGPNAIPIKQAFEMAHRAIERATGRKV